MYLTIVDETGMDRGARCWVTNFSQRIDPMLLHEIFQTLFSNLKINFIYIYEERKTNRLVVRQKHTLRKQVVVEYLNVWFR